ncbi:MAG TPA: pseudouridine synthase [Chthoniobacterales bacterium]
MRLNRFLALAGIASRRAAEEYIRHARVTVNGAIVTNLATQVASTDVVKVDGRRVQTQAYRYLLLYKPEGYITTRSDDRDRRTIYDLLPPGLPRFAHVGRLDLESEGLLLLTNDGELALKLTHPRHKLVKEYRVTLDRDFDMADYDKVKKGVYLAEGRARFDELRPAGSAQIRVFLTQGIKRQIRRVLAALGYRVKRLQRVALGPLTDHGLRPGEFRELTAAELETLRKGSRSRPAPPAEAKTVKHGSSTPVPPPPAENVKRRPLPRKTPTAPPRPKFAARRSKASRQTGSFRAAQSRSQPRRGRRASG